MGMLSAAVFTFSPTGATQAVTHALVQGMGLLDCRFVDLTLPQQRAGYDGICREDVVLLGAPVYDGALPQAYAQALRQLWGAGQPAVLCAAYGGLGSGDTLRELHTLALKARLRPVAAGLFPAGHPLAAAAPASPPGEPMLAAARELGFDTRFRLERGAHALHGSFHDALPKRGWPVGTLRALSPRRLLRPPQVLPACNRCGLCAQSCPVSAIRMPDVRIDPSLCLRCLRCLSACPLRALAASEPGIPGRLASMLLHHGKDADTALL